MEFKWIGPFKITKKLIKPKDYYQLQDVNDPTLKENQHVSRLKKWYERKPEEDPLEELEIPGSPPECNYSHLAHPLPRTQES